MSHMSFLTKYFWHTAVSPLHQSVALAAFLGSANSAQVMVYYECDRKTALRLKRIAKSLNIKNLQRGTIRNKERVSASLEPWWWIGTHDATSSHCPATWTADDHPRISLCLSTLDDEADPIMPTRHIPYISGWPI